METGDDYETRLNSAHMRVCTTAITAMREHPAITSYEGEFALDRIAKVAAVYVAERHQGLPSEEFVYTVLDELYEQLSALAGHRGLYE